MSIAHQRPDSCIQSYLGIHWQRAHSDAANPRQESSEKNSKLHVVVDIRAWF
ncbi:MAG: copper resistance protein B [Halieaceae bacterium]|nr:copper resistance protein B [Halieaceae bacterium]MCP4840886.1 copper resistance protein B [Halieaceae bacterium]